MYRIWLRNVARFSYITSALILLATWRIGRSRAMRFSAFLILWFRRLDVAWPVLRSAHHQFSLVRGSRDGRERGPALPYALAPALTHRSKWYSRPTKKKQKTKQQFSKREKMINTWTKWSWDDEKRKNKNTPENPKITKRMREEIEKSTAFQWYKYIRKIIKNMREILRMSRFDSL